MINTGNLRAMKERKTVVGRIRFTPNKQTKTKDVTRTKRLMGIVLHFGTGAYSFSLQDLNERIEASMPQSKGPTQNLL